MRSCRKQPPAAEPRPPSRQSSRLLFSFAPSLHHCIHLLDCQIWRGYRSSRRRINKDAPAWPMPLPKSLRRPVRRTSSSSSAGTQRRKCRTCNNLDPRGHANSVLDTEALNEPRATLDLILDALALSNAKPATNGGCRFCTVLVQALDAFFEAWRGARCRVNVNIREKGTIRVSLDGVQWTNQMIEIYAGSGRQCICILSVPEHVKTSSSYHTVLMSA